MNIINTAIPDVKIIEPKVFGDERGFFYESFSQRLFDEALGYHVAFVQDNHSRSVRGVLRGLHYQLPPFAQGKLVRCTVGKVFDVVVDIRRSSTTFGRWTGHVLSAANKRQLWIPAGFAHGFVTLSEHAEFLYKTTQYYAPSHDRGVLWNDPAIGIRWPDAGTLTLSPKDAQQPLLAAAELFD